MPYPLRIDNPALSHAELAKIGDRYGYDPVVRRLLIEIRALHNIVSRVHQLAQAAGPGHRADGFGIALAALHEQLKAETWLQEDIAKNEAYRAKLAGKEEGPYDRRTARRKGW